MLILAIETATERIGVAIVGSGGIVSSFEATRGRHHAEILVPSIEFACRQGDVDVSELSAVAVDVGPGLFTGMRVGLATAKAIAQALDVPVVPVTSLEVLAHAGRHSDKVIATVVDARKGQVFFGFHRAASEGVIGLGEPRVGSVSDLVAAVEDRGQEVLCIGDGAERYRSDLEVHRLVEVGDRHVAHPNVQHLAAIAFRRAMREQWLRAADVHAMYLRAPDAEINWSTRSSSPPAEVSS